jgi:excisionase family DNA binding protein
MEQMVNHTKAAEYLGVSKVTLWKLAKERQLPVYTDKLDRRKKLYRVSDLDKLKGVEEISE